MTSIKSKSNGGEEKPENWELRPSGMLVQKRIDSSQTTKPPLTIRVRVKYGSAYHDIYINSQATFGELKKMLSGPTGLHHEDQKIYYNKKERDSKQFLDIVGVKEKSKLVLMEDPISQEKRFIEMRRKAKLEKSSKLISQISLEVDKLVSEVVNLEGVILKGGRVSEKEILNLIELLMNELVKLDGIIVDGEVKLQRKMQVTRVQKYVETLDVLKAKNSIPVIPAVNVVNNNQKTTNVGKPPLVPKQQQRHPMVTTQWETFDVEPMLIALSPTRSPESGFKKLENPKFPWDF